ncbi:MAG: YceI family protein [Acidimicrobiales bacterium]|jgi:polyisoprenoid-binding protein YceI|nr:YceI family protein [Acidimicrobiales bacterium]
MKNRSKYVVVAVVLVVVAVVAAGAFWFLRDDAPDEVSLEQATESVDGDDAATTEEGTTAGAGSDEATGAGIDGTWTVDSESGDFDFESATGSFVGFRIQEELASIGSATAVGRTGDVTGTMEIEGTTVTAATFEVDLTTITTNESRRDDRVQQALETDQFPTATFTLSEPIELGESAAAGEPVTVDAPGELTIHGVTQQVVFPLEAQLVEGTVVVVGSIDVTFADYGVEVPSAPVVVSVEDTGVLELQLLLVPDGA